MLIHLQVSSVSPNYWSGKHGYADYSGRRARRKSEIENGCPDGTNKEIIRRRYNEFRSGGRNSNSPTVVRFSGTDYDGGAPVVRLWLYINSNYQGSGYYSLSAYWRSSVSGRTEIARWGSQGQNCNSGASYHSSNLVAVGYNDPQNFERGRQSCSQAADGFKDGRPGCNHKNYNMNGLSYYSTNGWNELQLQKHEGGGPHWNEVQLYMCGPG